MLAEKRKKKKKFLLKNRLKLPKTVTKQVEKWKTAKNPDKLKMSDSEDDSSNEMDVDNTGKIKARKKRIRQYEKSHKGPFVVYIRVIDEHTPLKPIKLNKIHFRHLQVISGCSPS